MAIEFIALQKKVVNEITAFQAQAALAHVGLLDAVKTYIATTDALTQLRWEKALTFRRDHTDVIAIATVLGLTDVQLDELFELGRTMQL